ncbi:hypothetical protein BDFB_007274 [Asbolus verrucosus]|uniref:Uncharacterized protein n=1 Tax=Asbolus verrucosus TaxID=1661398 RepID=A0A482W2I4_ASBVE|nr:hypothetical protein BDFB_007274 [Asbolus verrucosus]
MSKQPLENMKGAYKSKYKTKLVLKTFIAEKYADNKFVEWFEYEKFRFKLHVLVYRTAQRILNGLSVIYVPNKRRAKVKYEVQNHALLKQSTGFSENYVYTKLNESRDSETQPPEEINWFECEQCVYKTKEKFSLSKHILTKRTNPERTERFMRLSSFNVINVRMEQKRNFRFI